MEVMVIYVWQCMVVLLYDCICAWWLWSMHCIYIMTVLTSSEHSYKN